MTVQGFIAQPFIIVLPLSWYDFNNVERNVKHQTVISSFLKGRVVTFSKECFLFEVYPG